MEENNKFRLVLESTLYRNNLIEEKHVITKYEHENETLNMCFARALCDLFVDVAFPGNCDGEEILEEIIEWSFNYSDANYIKIHRSLKYLVDEIFQSSMHADKEMVKLENKIRKLRKHYESKRQKGAEPGKQIDVMG